MKIHFGSTKILSQYWPKFSPKFLWDNHSQILWFFSYLRETSKPTGGKTIQILALKCLKSSKFSKTNFGSKVYYSKNIGESLITVMRSIYSLRIVPRFFISLFQIWENFKSILKKDSSNTCFSKCKRFSVL